jgi:hypothetical protein
MKHHSLGPARKACKDLPKQKIQPREKKKKKKTVLPQKRLILEGRIRRLNTCWWELDLRGLLEFRGNRPENRGAG